ncbi:UNVERIFIED_CONTAM: hypothetical protein FKN15_054577 [Acipenser sinensis]
MDKLPNLPEEVLGLWCQCSQFPKETPRSALYWLLCFVQTQKLLFFLQMHGTFLLTMGQQNCKHHMIIIAQLPYRKRVRQETPKEEEFEKEHNEDDFNIHELLTTPFTKSGVIVKQFFLNSLEFLLVSVKRQLKNPFECDCGIQDTAYYFQSKPKLLIGQRSTDANYLTASVVRKSVMCRYRAQCNLGVVIGVLIACILLAAILSVFLCRKYNKDMGIRTRAQRVYQQVSICNQTQPEMPLENM